MLEQAGIFLISKYSRAFGSVTMGSHISEISSMAILKPLPAL